MKRAKKRRTQNSLARIVVRQFSDMDVRMEQFIADKLSAMDCNYQEEHQFNFIIELVETFSKVDDQSTHKRVIMSLDRTNGLLFTTIMR